MRIRATIEARPWYILRVEYTEGVVTKSFSTDINIIEARLRFPWHQSLDSLRRAGEQGRLTADIGLVRVTFPAKGWKIVANGLTLLPPTAAIVKAVDIAPSQLTREVRPDADVWRQAVLEAERLGGKAFYFPSFMKILIFRFRPEDSHDPVMGVLEEAGIAESSAPFPTPVSEPAPVPQAEEPCSWFQKLELDDDDDDDASRSPFPVDPEANVRFQKVEIE